MLRKPRSYAEVYNDLDGEIVNVFAVARDRGPELLDALRLTPFARDEFVLSYKPTSDPVEQARRSIARSFMGFGSAAACGEATGFRANSNRSGTTPAHDWRNYADVFATIIERLRGVVIENRPALDVIAAHDGSDTCFYVDPPYVHSTRGKRRADKGYRHELLDADHEALAEALHGVSGHVVLSGYRGPLYESLYADWQRVDALAYADGARARVESLWMSKPANQQRMFA